MTLGLTCAAFVLVMGELEMSVCADKTGVEIIDDSTRAQPMAWRSVDRFSGSIPRFSFILPTALAFIAGSVEIEDVPKARARRTDMWCLRTAPVHCAAVVLHARPATKGNCPSVPQRCVGKVTLQC